MIPRVEPKVDIKNPEAKKSLNIFNAMDITPGTQHIALWGSILQVCLLTYILLVIKFL